jgi:hypothetical protein
MKGEQMSESNAGLTLPDEIVALVDGAFEKRLPILVAYVNDDQQARLGFRGSAHVDDSGKIGLWIRNPEGGILKAVGAHPKLTLMYRDPESRTTLFFYGNGEIVSDSAVRTRVYEGSPERERNADAEIKGSAILVTIDRVEGRLPEGPFALPA